nr:phenoloxidase-activating factor 2 isoform X2 [Helicoverpa armigera]
MRVLIAAAFLMLARAQSTIDPNILAGIFGTPPTPAPNYGGSTTQRLEDVDQETRMNAQTNGHPTLKTSVLVEIFGTPPTPPLGPGTKRNEDITVKPTEGPTTHVDENGKSCQCVPYYLCDANNVGVDVNNASVTGWGVLDIRFGEDDNQRQCQESVEVCCSVPRDPADVPKPDPKPKPGHPVGCGYRNPKGLGGITITGNTGGETQFGEFPWVVAVMSQNGSYAGVGVLIHPQVVMTAAHIAFKFGSNLIQNLKIRAGEWDTQTTKEIYPFQERTVQDYYINENFMPKSLKNDVALLLLESPVEISEHINVICMPEQDEVFDSHKNCVANGWGKSHFELHDRYAVILKKVEVDMVPNTRCNALLKRTRLGHNFQLHRSFVCAGGEEGKDTCQGDGGAPLACPIGNNRYKLTGLVAWGIGCGQKDVPAVYVNVPLFRSWVDDKMARWGMEATSYRISNVD